jgi:transcriptional regulator with XRE-family HTH domain
MASEFTTALCARVRALRQATGMTQAGMAKALGVGAEAYRTYETYIPLPHVLIEPFARLTGTTVEYLVTGREPAPRRARKTAAQ